MTLRLTTLSGRLMLNFSERSLSNFRYYKTGLTTSVGKIYGNTVTRMNTSFRNKLLTVRCFFFHFGCSYVEFVHYLVSKDSIGWVFR